MDVKKRWIASTYAFSVFPGFHRFRKNCEMIAKYMHKALQLASKKYLLLSIGTQKIRLSGLNIVM